MQRLDTLTLRSKEQSTNDLVGSLERWNDSKQAEEHDRIKHANFEEDF